MKYLFPSKRFLQKFFILGFSLMFLTQFVVSQTYFCDLEDSVRSDIWIGQQTIDSGWAYSGSFISITDSVNPYGLGVEMSFPEEKKGTNTWVTVSGWVKSSASFPHALFVVTVRESGKEYFWQGIQLDTLITTAEKWYKFNGTFKFPASLTRTGELKSYLWNAGGKDTVAIDDLEIDFAKVVNPSFLPDMELRDDRADENNFSELLYINQFYSLWLEGNPQRLVVSGKDGKKVVKALFSVTDLTVNGNRIIEQTPFVLKSTITKNGGAELFFIARNEYSVKHMTLKCFTDQPEISVEITEKYRKEIVCHRSALVLESAQQVTEVFRASRKSDTAVFQDEYWLAQQGVAFGEDGHSLLIYHTPQVSSLQLNTKNNWLAINLDYEKDHPFLHFPLDNDTTDYKQDWSASTYRKGNKRVNLLSIYVGVATGSLPRFMKNPAGFLATYIWTEHADFTEIRTNRASYYGSEKINNPKDATGGFIKYNIPVTKSVFYDNPDKITNTEISNGVFTGQESAIRTDKDFHDFLEQISSRDIEICLHTPEQFTTTPTRLKKALKFFRGHYGSVSWIDHGYNNHLENNREDLMCDGLLKRSPYYAARLWKKYGVKYFWNAYYEDYFTFADWKFDSSIEPYYAGYGDFMPKPDYWRHPTRSGNIIHWPTSTVLYISNDEMWDYFFNEQNLNDFVADWSVEMNHCYPAWVNPQKGFWTYDTDSVIVAQPGFNRTLERMASLRERKELNITTVKEFIDYQLKLENIEYDVLSDGRIRITNHNREDVNGLSFATKAKTILVDQQKPEQKIYGSDLIFWFDIKAGASRIIKIVD